MSAIWRKTRVVFNNPRVFITASVERKWRMMEEEVIPKAAQVMESDQSVSHTDDTPLLDSNIFLGGPPNNRSNRNAISNYFSIHCGFFCREASHALHLSSSSHSNWFAIFEMLHERRVSDWPVNISWFHCLWNLKFEYLSLNYIKQNRLKDDLRFWRGFSIETLSTHEYDNNNISFSCWWAW